MTFGVPLDYVIRTSSKNGIPLLLYCCFEAIENRGIFALVLMCFLGLSKQGVYRISCKKTVLDEMKAKIETNINSLEKLNEIPDIHLLTGLVKSYLREIPNPIFPFSLKDRAEYSGTLFPRRFNIF